VERQADERIRTADPFITSEVLYQLSYVGPGAPKGPTTTKPSEPATRIEGPSRTGPAGVDRAVEGGHGSGAERERRRTIQSLACTFQPRERGVNGMRRREQFDRVGTVTERAIGPELVTRAPGGASRSIGARRRLGVPDASRLPARAGMRRTWHGPPRMRGRITEAWSGPWPRGGDGLWTLR
jgi:hypothetical protein